MPQPDPPPTVPLARGPLVTVRGLTYRVGRQGSVSVLLNRANFEIAPAERLALRGASGSGKSTLLHGLLGLTPAGADVEGRLTVAEPGGARSYDLRDPDAVAPLRGRVFALVPQRALASLDPVRRIGRQLAELVELYGRGEDPRTLLARVDLPPTCEDLVPGELSGGMARRVALAMALAGRPALILADEPTAGLDPLTRDRVLGEIDDVCSQLGAALLLATHSDVAAARLCARTIELRDGRMVEPSLVG
ncbi:MAG: ATP-binding cassette domain-containing protein [Myxococcales bacterium FL481]|nr:MAG: ATP-binding cassette domain-containing protein [Myxococcales bacterium FL481]